LAFLTTMSLPTKSAPVPLPLPSPFQPGRIAPLAPARHFFTPLVGQLALPDNKDHAATPPRLFVHLRNTVHTGNGIAGTNRGQEDTLLAAVKAALAITQFEVRQPGIAAEDHAEGRWSNDAAIRGGLRIR